MDDNEGVDKNIDNLPTGTAEPNNKPADANQPTIPAFDEPTIPIGNNQALIENADTPSSSVGSINGGASQPPNLFTNSPVNDETEDSTIAKADAFFTRSLTIRVLMHIGVALGIVILVFGSSIVLSGWAENKAQTWVVNLRPGRRTGGGQESELPKERLIVNTGLENPDHPLSAIQKDRLQNQLDDVRKRAKHHLDVAIFYYANSFMAIIAFSLAAGLGAISLAVISKRGIDHVSEYIVTMFLVATALALFYQSFPGVFQQKQNVDNNRALYIKYVNLEDDMISYVATGSVTFLQQKPDTAAPIAKNPIENKSTTNAIALNGLSNTTPATNEKTIGSDYMIVQLAPDDFIHYVDFQLKKYNDIAIGFDESKAASFAKDSFKTE